MTPIWKKDGGGWQLLAPIGFPDESSLQSLVEKAPHVLPLAGSPRMVIVGREVMLGNGYADLIAIEPTGRLAILEVKLARNSEARRAVVAQVLTYAAYLNGLDPIVVERDVLAGHLKQRGYETLPSAVESNDQEGSFDLGDFAKGLSDCLAQGRFRIVLVLDDAPEELVRLVGYLGAVTEGRLLIDLITVSIYRIGDSEVIVPQRVESERRPVEVPDKTNRTITAACTVEGVEDFDASIASLPAQQQAPLKRLRDWAVSLTKGGLIKLQTTHSKTPNFLALLIRLVDENSGLATIYNNNGTAALQIWSRALQRRAPKALTKIEKIAAGEKLGHGTIVKNVSQELLDALSEA